MAIAYVALGSNCGDREKFIDQSVELISEIPDTSVKSQSQFKEYEAAESCMGQNSFLNGVIELQTDLLPLELLHKLQVIERRLGRTSKGEGAARSIDLDILSYGETVVFEGKTLTLPHPKIQDRIFVLEPLTEIAEEWKHPKLNQTSKELLNILMDSSDEDDNNREVDSVHSAIPAE